eukprot:GHVN01057649.1.p2 GENE.GHVN01057649.1~~GHVN01057649.1.p2  ORF type:complete len:191 (+),score=35.82 GHVN01057649.1:102-674(+)
MSFPEDQYMPLYGGLALEKKRLEDERDPQGGSHENEEGDPKFGSLTEWDSFELSETHKSLQRGVVNSVGNVLQVYQAARRRDTNGVRQGVADMTRSGGPEATGAWAAVKMATGMGAVLTGHMIIGGGMFLWGAAAVAGASVWGFNREAVDQWIRGETTSQEEDREEKEEEVSDGEPMTSELDDVFSRIDQ